MSRDAVMREICVVVVVDSGDDAQEALPTVLDRCCARDECVVRCL